MASGNTLLIFSPYNCEYPPTGYASITVNNNHPVLEYSDNGVISVYFRAVMPRNYANGGVTASIFWSPAANNTGSVVWSMRWERLLGTAISADSFANTVLSSASASTGTLGLVSTATIVFTHAQMDGVTAGEPFRIQLFREGTNAADTMTTIAHFVLLELRET